MVSVGVPAPQGRTVRLVDLFCAGMTLARRCPAGMPQGVTRGHRGKSVRVNQPDSSEWLPAGFMGVSVDG